jgi:hypothetical protein
MIRKFRSFQLSQRHRDLLIAPPVASDRNAIRTRRPCTFLNTSSMGWLGGIMIGPSMGDVFRRPARRDLQTSAAI